MGAAETVPAKAEVKTMARQTAKATLNSPCLFIGFPPWSILLPFGSPLSLTCCITRDRAQGGMAGTPILGACDGDIAVFGVITQSQMMPVNS